MLPPRYRGRRGFTLLELIIVMALLCTMMALVAPTVTGTLRSLAAKADEAGLRGPTVIIVGTVVRLRDKLNWYAPESVEAGGMRPDSTAAQPVATSEAQPIATSEAKKWRAAC